MTEEGEPVIPPVLAQAIAELRRDRLTIIEMGARLQADGRGAALQDSGIAARIVADALKRQGKRSTSTI